MHYVSWEEVRRSALERYQNFTYKKAHPIHTLTEYCSVCLQTTDLCREQTHKKRHLDCKDSCYCKMEKEEEQVVEYERQDTLQQKKDKWKNRYKRAEEKTSYMRKELAEKQAENAVLKAELESLQQQNDLLNKQLKEAQDIAKLFLD